MASNSGGALLCRRLWACEVYEDREHVILHYVKYRPPRCGNIGGLGEYNGEEASVHDWMVSMESGLVRELRSGMEANEILWHH